MQSLLLLLGTACRSVSQNGGLSCHLVFYLFLPFFYWHFNLCILRLFPKLNHVSFRVVNCFVLFCFKIKIRIFYLTFGQVERKLFWQFFLFESNLLMRRGKSFVLSLAFILIKPARSGIARASSNCSLIKCVQTRELICGILHSAPLYSRYKQKRSLIFIHFGGRYFYVPTQIWLVKEHMNRISSVYHNICWIITFYYGGVEWKK